jgi:transcription-repair coupling factor (superfamily II helicase)
MQNIVSYFSEGEFKDSARLFFTNKSITYSGAGLSSSKALVLSNILRLSEEGGSGTVSLGNVLWIVNNFDEMEDIKRAMSVWGGRPVYDYIAVTDDERGNFSSSRDFERAKQIRMVEFVVRMSAGGGVFIVPFSSVFQKFPKGEELVRNKFKIKVSDEVDVVKFMEKLLEAGYDSADDEHVKKGQYFKIGDSVILWPVNFDSAYRIEFSFDKIDAIHVYDVEDKKEAGSKKSLEIFPIEHSEFSDGILDEIGENGAVIDDEVDVSDDFFDAWDAFMERASGVARTVSFTSFNEDEETHKHLHFFSVLKYRTAYDFANDLRDKIAGGYRVLIFTKIFDEVCSLLADQNVPFHRELPKEGFESVLSVKDEGARGSGTLTRLGAVFLVKVDKEDIFPQAFQSPDHKVLLLTDIEISLLKEKDTGRALGQKVFEDFLGGLKVGDFVVHSDHGIARFQGLDRKTVDDITREYLKLGYAENDKLFVPIDQADKVSKYIGSEETMPKLTRLGSAEWATITSKVRKETEKIAKELLELYAKRKVSAGFAFAKDENVQEEFEKTFPYEETPGQMKAINDVKSDMEAAKPMDRLICGDVGFGKTEVAMRAAFKAVQSGKQVALISPITILADQHYKSFCKRMMQFNVRVEMMSRFRSKSEQKEILRRLERGEVDIVVGTHRLLQPDVKFKDLGLIVVDEEQRFGVSQKEKLKKFRAEVDVLTLTATPIPRTLNICLNKLRDITTITTPPPGRLPVITEVRKYSPGLVRDAILREIGRHGQVYFLHNKVQTIDSIAEGLRALVPEATFGVAHGQLGSGDLEERVMSFKEHKFDVLVSSTIIENGIDLANVNTLIVNDAEKFGLAQLYQLRGRVGRSKAQAYAYFLYHGQRLHLDAKKRLRAIVEASDLGSGFQIAMKDLEIRGAGDILGANQHGVINIVGVTHFMRMLNKAVEDLKAGRAAGAGAGLVEEASVSIELPIPAYIPDTYIVNSKDKINAYQRLAGVDNFEYLEEVREDMLGEFGKMPREVSNLFRIIELKILCKKAGVTNVRAETVHGGAARGANSAGKEIVLTMGPKVKPANIISLLEYNPSWTISGSRLRVGISALGLQWFEELKNCVGKLSEEAKHGKR